MHGGVKFYRGSAAAARNYVEADRSRVDDYYLAEGTGIATRYVAGIAATPDRGDRGERSQERGRNAGRRWSATGGRWTGTATSGGSAATTTTGAAKGRLRTDEHGLRFVEVVVNGPKTWSLAAALHPEVAAAYDAAQDRAAGRSSGGWPSTPPPGSGRAAVRSRCRSMSSRRRWCGTTPRVPGTRTVTCTCRSTPASAPDGAWRGLHSVGVVDSIEAINGIGHAAVMCDPHLRQTLAAHGYTLDPDTGEVRELADYAGAFSRPGGADQPQRRPLRGRLAPRAPRHRARPEAAPHLGPPRLG